MTPDPGLPLQIRPATNEDISFIFNSWLKSYREKGTACRNVEQKIYYENQHRLIERLLEKIAPEGGVRVACNVNDPTQLFGFICAERVEGVFVIHYIYVKHSMRRFGIGSALLNSFDHDPSVASAATHQTSASYRLEPKYRVIYHPYLLLFDYGDRYAKKVHVNESSGESGDSSDIGDQS